jgi:MerC mercury resistance protein
MEQCVSSPIRVLDRLGMSASLACAVHCAVLPLLLAALPAIGLAWLDSAWVDWTTVALAAVIALRAHRGGFRLHRSCLPSAVAVAGLLAIITTICLLKGSASHPLHSGFWSSRGCQLSFSEPAPMPQLHGVQRRDTCRGVRER